MEKRRARKGCGVCDVGEVRAKRWEDHLAHHVPHMHPKHACTMLLAVISTSAVESKRRNTQQTVATTGGHHWACCTSDTVFTKRAMVDPSPRTRRLERGEESWQGPTSGASRCQPAPACCGAAAPAGRPCCCSTMSLRARAAAFGFSKPYICLHMCRKGVEMLDQRWRGNSWAPVTLFYVNHTVCLCSLSFNRHCDRSGDM